MAQRTVNSIETSTKEYVDEVAGELKLYVDAATSDLKTYVDERDAQLNEYVNERTVQTALYIDEVETALRASLQLLSIGSIAGQIEVVVDKAYSLDPIALWHYQIEKLFVKCAQGTCKVSLLLNGSAIAGAQLISVTTTLTEINLANKPIVAIGSELELTVTGSDIGAPEDLKFSILYTRLVEGASN